MAKVSISIPTYNGALYLEECLDSAISQTFADIEIVIVDDCSTDETLGIAERYAKQDRRIRVFRNKKRLGLVGNWNKSIQYSTGEWVKFLFQDDSLDENCIEKMLKAAETKETGATKNLIVSERNFVIENGVAENLRHFYENSAISLADIFPGRSCILPEELSEAILERGVGVNFVGEPTSVMIRRDICFQYSFFNPNLVHLCDLEYWTRIGTNERLVYLPEKLVDFRVHNQSASAYNHAHKQFQLEYLDNIILLHDYLYHPFYENFRRVSDSETRLSEHLKNEIRNCLNPLGGVKIAEMRAQFQVLTKKYPSLNQYLIHSKNSWPIR
jgi:glycosyltransferase involved in cell wall biosynthesis